MSVEFEMQITNKQGAVLLVKQDDWIGDYDGRWMRAHKCKLNEFCFESETGQNAVNFISVQHCYRRGES